jgi:hypothetical protein
MYAILIVLLSFATVASAEMRVTTDDAIKAATKKNEPDYPPIAKQLRVAGKVRWTRPLTRQEMWRASKSFRATRC